jgi:hypothetical protein
MPPLAYFGIESSGFSLAVNLLILFLVVLYFSLIYWTFQDARRRIADPVMIGLATFVSCFPFVGAIVYMILRPPEYLEDVRERELEMHAAQARINQLDQVLCPHCDYRVEPDFVRCPSCLRKLKERCVNCSRPLDQAWTICPYCEADVPGLSAPRARRRRTAAAVESDHPALGESDLERPRVTDDDAAEEADPTEPEPAVASEAAVRASERRTGRSGRPGSRPRPTS